MSGALLRLLVLAPGVLLIGTGAFHSAHGDGLQRPDSSNRVYPLKALETTALKLGSRQLTAWVMDTPGKRAEGFMYLSSAEVRATDAMIFAFPDSAIRSFWNQNVYFDLDIAFLDESGKVVRLAILRALDPTPVPSGGPAKFALEMKRGGFKRLGLLPGARILIPADVRGR